MKHANTFQKRLYQLEREHILALREFDAGQINNVVVGIEKECYGLLLKDDTDDIIYQVFYINGVSGLTGYLLELSSALKSRNELVFIFSHFLSQKYPHLNQYTTFNTFQHFVRTLFEKLGFFTFTDDTFRSIKDRRASLIFKVGEDGVKGMAYVPFIKESDVTTYSRKSLPSKTVSDKPLPKKPPSDNFVYILHNHQNGYYKIGRSKYPFFRERTLQAQEPDIELVHKWKAPRSSEKVLHGKYHEKHLRGEWFKLDDHDISEICEIMKDYE